MRQRLFAIRAHLSRVPGILRLEERVSEAISQAELANGDLEPLAAWSNRPVQPAAFEKVPVLDRSDPTIDAVRNAETEAWKILPPDSSRDEDSFPALEGNMIVRIRRAPLRNAPNGPVKCVQEIWRMESGMLGSRSVMRTFQPDSYRPADGDADARGRCHALLQRFAGGCARRSVRRVRVG